MQRLSKLLRPAAALIALSALSALAVPRAGAQQGAAPAPAAAAVAAPEVTLELIMGDPDWLGNPPEDPYWADDGRSIYFSQKVPGEEHRDLVQIDLSGRRIRTFGVGERAAADTSGTLSPDARRKLFLREGDLFVKDLTTGATRQLTRTVEPEARPRWTADGNGVIFVRGDTVLVRDLATGLESQPADLRLEKDPAEEKEPGFLEAQQKRLIGFVRETEEEKEKARERERQDRRLDPTRVPPPFYLGDDVEILQASLSPAGRWMLVTLGKKDESPGKKDTVPAFVTASGYVETREVRPKVGTGEQSGERLLLLDLESHESHELSLDVLPGILEDPLAELRAKAAAEKEAEKAKGTGLEEEDLEPKELLRPEEEAVTEGEAIGQEVEAEPESEQEDDAEDGAEAAAEEEKPKARPLGFTPPVWSEDGRRVALRAFSFDNKDRWIATVDFAAHELVPVHRLHDPAWVNWNFHELGWLPDGDRLWYLSEESGYSQLYLADLSAPGTPPPAPEPPPQPETVGAADAEDEAAVRVVSVEPIRPAGKTWGAAYAGRHRRLTEGGFVVSDVEPTRDGAYLYYQANAGHPGRYEIWRVAAASGVNEQLTSLAGMSSALLSPDERQLLIVHSTTTHPPELYLQPAVPGAPAERLTHTASRELEAIAWSAPEIVAVPSSHADRPIYSRLYLPQEAATAAPGSLPAVFFTHGAGYLQNAHAGWSDYFREFMFHTFLTRQGYVVLDMDYRASAGYGRDWRTAIYRHMGGPELEDLTDGVAWLVASYPVDRQRIGTYGGSYGGFLTMMALFTQPDLFACGAALRPVTDWAHYNHGYTSNILNTPEIDPEAYQRSSPIEFADGLEKPLLICAPMLDDNVLFQDTVRLAQKLIELGKEDWEVAIYPVESHGFLQPSSWLDEYRRIYKLFEENLKPCSCAP